MMKASNSGGFSGGGGFTSTGRGTQFNPGAVTTPNGDTIDKHTENLIVNKITANYISSKIANTDLGTVTTLAVKNLYVGNSRIDVEERFDDIGR